jgi:uncharacterized membrane protein YphA (DoxX/SURF4 family)
MNVILWIIQILLAAVFLLTGVGKVIRPSEKLKTGAPEYHPVMIRLIAVAEILGALGLILPGVTGIATILTPLAAAGLAVIMIGAIVTHARRKNVRSTVVNTVLLILTVVVAVGRFLLPL